MRPLALALCALATARGDPRVGEVARVASATHGTPLAEPCWGRFADGASACTTYDQALAQDAGFTDVGAVTVVVSWCGDPFKWVTRLMRKSRGAQRVWKRLVVYQKCRVVVRNGRAVVAFRHFIKKNNRQMPLGDLRASGPGNSTLTPEDVRHALFAYHGAGRLKRDARSALEALDVRVVHMLEPGRGYPFENARPPFSTDEVGAYLHYCSTAYDDLLDGTFFVHGHVHGGLRPVIRAMDWTAKQGVAPQTWFGTTHAYDMAHDGPMPAHLGLHPDDLSKKRHGNYRNGEFFASRLAIRRRSVDFYRKAYDTVVRDAKCADVYNGVTTRLPKPMEHYSDGSDCPQPRRYGGSGRIEGYWSAFMCEPCAMPRRGEDPRLPFCYGGSKCADSMR